MIERESKGPTVTVTNTVDREDRLPVTVTVTVDREQLVAHLPRFDGGEPLAQWAAWRQQREAFADLQRTVSRMTEEAIRALLNDCTVIERPRVPARLPANELAEVGAR